MQKELADARESLYLLSIEIMILYLFAFGMLSLKTDNMFSVGMAYPATLITFLLAYLLPVLALVSGLLGFEHSYRAAMRSALGAAVFVCVAFLVLAVLVMSLWSSPLICVYNDDASADCHVKGDTVPLRQVEGAARNTVDDGVEALDFGIPTRFVDVDQSWHAA
jgi:hypothetical protein